MGDVLSQEEIDKLIQAMAEGKIPPDALKGGGGGGSIGLSQEELDKILSG